MAEYRPIHTGMWNSDEWFADLATDQRLLWVYLLTNPRASSSGLYAFPLRFVPAEVGLSCDAILEILGQFAAAGKAYFEGGYIWVVNMRRYQSGSEKLQKGIRADVDRVPNSRLKVSHMLFYQDITKEESAKMGYAMDTLYIPSDTISAKKTNETKETKQEAVTPTSANSKTSAPAREEPPPPAFIPEFPFDPRKYRHTRKLHDACWQTYERVLLPPTIGADPVETLEKQLAKLEPRAQRVKGLSAVEVAMDILSRLTIEGKGPLLGVAQKALRFAFEDFPGSDEPEGEVVKVIDPNELQRKREQDAEEIRLHDATIARNIAMAGKRRADREAANRAARGSE